VFESLEPRLTLTTLDITGTTLTVTVGTNHLCQIGGNSLNGSSGAPLSLAASDGVTLSGSAATYFNTVASAVLLKPGKTLDALTSIVIGSSHSGSSTCFIFGDSTNTLPDFGAAVSVSSDITVVLFQSNVTTTDNTQDYTCPVEIQGTVTLAGSGIEFGGAINGDTSTSSNDRLTLDSAAGLVISGTIGQTTPLDYLSLTADTGDVTLGATKIDGTDSQLRISTNGNMSQTGIFSGSMGLTLVAGSAELDQANTFHGAITVLDGVLTLSQGTSTARTGNLVVGDGTGAAASAQVLFGAGSQLATTASVTVKGDGRVDLDACNQTINDLVMTAGTVTSDTGVLTLDGTLRATSAEVGGADTAATIGGQLALGTGNEGIHLFTVTAGTNTVDLLITALVSGEYMLKGGDGVMRFHGAGGNNTFKILFAEDGTVELYQTGGYAVSELTVGGGENGETATVRLLANSQLANNHTLHIWKDGHLDLNGFSQAVDGIAFQGGEITTGSGTLTLATIATMSGAFARETATIRGNLDLDGGVRGFHVDACFTPGTPDLVIDGVIRNGGLTLTSCLQSDGGAGTLRLIGNAANTYTGVTTVEKGTLELNKSGASAVAGNVVIGDGEGDPGSATVCLFANDQLAETSTATILSSGQLLLNGHQQTLAGLTMTGGRVLTDAGTLTLAGDVTTNACDPAATISGRVDLGGQTRTFTVADGDPQNSLVVSAVISNGAIRKAGDGTLRLTGANTCDGDSTLEAGTLIVNGALGGTLALDGGTLTGSGTVGTVSVDGGTIAPDIALGTLSAAAVAAESGATFAFSLDTQSGELSADCLLDVSGTLALGGDALEINTSQAYVMGDTVVLAVAQGGISGVFDNAGDGSIIRASNGLRFRIHITATEVTASVVIDAAQTVGQYDAATSTFALRYSNSSGTADSTFGFGVPGAGWVPIIGDWNGDGIDTIGLFDPQTATWYLRNTNSTGVADLTFGYGAGDAEWTPIVGDWNGDGIDTIGLFDPQTSTWYLRNSNSTGMADLTFGYGAGGASWTPIVGDWNGNGIDTIGLFDAQTSTWYLRNSNSTGMADLTFGYGATGWTSVVGDWNGDGTTTIGLYDIEHATWYLRDSNTSGLADNIFAFGVEGSDVQPRAGAWVLPLTGLDAAAVDELDLGALADEALSLEPPFSA
jgi:autotransporter-associated beta strand protein